MSMQSIDRSRGRRGVLTGGRTLVVVAWASPDAFGALLECLPAALLVGRDFSARGGGGGSHSGVWGVWCGRWIDDDKQGTGRGPVSASRGRAASRVVGFCVVRGGKERGGARAQPTTAARRALPRILPPCPPPISRQSIPLCI
jgi:hypothetical protein